MSLFSTILTLCNYCRKIHLTGTEDIEGTKTDVRINKLLNKSIYSIGL